MPIVYKIDALQALKSKGFSSYKLRKERIFGEADIQNMRKRVLPSWSVLSRLCSLLECQPGDVVAYMPDDATTNNQP